jgi:UDP-3-O-[3-hydroxymyristoyl] glucosamine N-acyltransferase
MRSVDVTIAQITTDLGGELVGSPKSRITAIASLERATSSDISFLSSAKYTHQFSTSQAGCVIARHADWESARDKGYQGAAILTPDPYVYYARLTQWWKLRMLLPSQEPLIHPSAVIGKHAQVGVGVHIGALCVIEDGAVIGARTRLAARVTVGADCRIGENCILHSGVFLSMSGTDSTCAKAKPNLPNKSVNAFVVTATVSELYACPTAILTSDLNSSSLPK